MPGHRRADLGRLLFPSQAGDALHPSRLAAEGCIRTGGPRYWRRFGYWKIDVFEVASVKWKTSGGRLDIFYRFARLGATVVTWDIDKVR